MHDCQKFREDWIAGVDETIADCAECLIFCKEANAILQAAADTSEYEEALPEAYWNAFDTRLHQKLVLENASRRAHFYWKWSGVAAAAALALVVSWGNLHDIIAKPERVEFNDDHIQGLDPMVVTFLRQSEMFLRSFTKIDSSDVEDLADARAQARQQLMETAKQRMMAANFAPVRITLDEYERVLRDIKNLDSPKDLADIQMRIRRNGLIANLKAYQPRLMLLSLR